MSKKKSPRKGSADSHANDCAFDKLEKVMSESTLLGMEHKEDFERSPKSQGCNPKLRLAEQDQEPCKGRGHPKPHTLFKNRLESQG